MALFKEFPINKLREGAHLEFRAEVFNLLNHPQWGSVDSGLGDGAFGQITSTVDGTFRQMQLGLKLYF